MTYICFVSGVISVSCTILFIHACLIGDVLEKVSTRGMPLPNTPSHDLDDATCRYFKHDNMLTSSQLLNLLPLPLISGAVLASPLSLCFVTSWTRDAWDQPVTFFVLKMPAQYLPWAIIFLKLIIGSPRAAMIEATGLVAAYVYDLMTGLYPNFGIKRNFIATPRWMNKMLGVQRVVERPYGSIIVPGGGEAAWGLDLSWKRFGPGHTLGGEGVRVDRQRPKGLALAAMVMGAFVLLCLVLGYLFLQPDTWPVLGLPWLGAATDTPKSGI